MFSLRVLTRVGSEHWIKIKPSTLLEEIVSKLERGEATLDESLKLFEEGSKLVAQCSSMLDKAEQKVIRLEESGHKKTGEEA